MRALRSEEGAVPGDSIMTDASTPRATAQPFLRSAILSLLLAGSGLAWGEPPEPLARYIPAEGLTALLEHDGLGAHPEAWKASAAYKMLNETTLGAMLEDILAQVADRALQSGPGAPVSGKELVMLLSHLADKGFAVGYQHNPQPPQPKAVFLVIRDAADSALIRRLISRIPPLNEPMAQQREAPGGRKVWTVDEQRMHIRWWFEKRRPGPVVRAGFGRQPDRRDARGQGGERPETPGL